MCFLDIFVLKAVSLYSYDSGSGARQRRQIHGWFANPWDVVGNDAFIVVNAIFSQVRLRALIGLLLRNVHIERFFRIKDELHVIRQHV